MRKQKIQTRERIRGGEAEWLGMRQQNNSIDVSDVQQYVLNVI